MDIRIACRNNVQHTEELDRHIKLQLNKVVSFLEHHQKPITIDVVIEGHPTHAHNRVNVHVLSPEFETIVHREGKNVYALIDEVIDITYTELHKEKEKHVHDRKNRGTHRGV